MVVVECYREVKQGIWNHPCGTGLELRASMELLFFVYRHGLLHMEIFIANTEIYMYVCQYTHRDLFASSAVY